MRKTFRALTSILAAIGLLQVAVTFTPLTKWWSYKLGGGFDNPKGDLLIVVAASSLEDGTLMGESYRRCLFAVWAWREGGFKKVILSGGGDGVPAAAGMKNFFVVNGVPESAIVTEQRSRSTRENAVEVKRMLGNPESRPVLLTSDYHMYRTKRAFEKAGLPVLPRSIPDGVWQGGEWTRRWGIFQTLMVETAKIGYYKVRGWI